MSAHQSPRPYQAFLLFFTLMLFAGTGQGADTPTGRTISGRLFQWQPATGATGSGLAGVTVLLRNGFDGSLVDRKTTDTTGAYSFVINSVQSYSLQVDLSSASAIPVAVWSGPGGDCQGADGSKFNQVTAGLCLQPPNSPATINVPAGSLDISGLDLGFSYDLVTATGDSGPGSLRQFIANANQGKGQGLMRFVPLSPADSGSGWQLSLNSPLQALTRFDARLDGRAYNPNNLNQPRPATATLMSGYSAGAASRSIPGFARADLELVGRPGTAVLTLAGDNQQVRGLAISGGRVGIQVNAGTGILIQDNFIGADRSGAMAAKTLQQGIESADNTRITIDHNLIRGTSGSAITLRMSGTVRNNLLLGNASEGEAAAIALVNPSYLNPGPKITVENNHVSGAGGAVVDGNNLVFPNELMITDNTLIGGARAGLRVMTREREDKRLDIAGNLFRANQGSAIVVSHPNHANPSKGNRVSANRFTGNAGPPIDLVMDHTRAPFGDGANGNSGHYVYQPASSSNWGIDRPIIERITLDSSNNKLLVEGYAMPGLQLDFHVKKGSDYRFLYSRREGEGVDGKEDWDTSWASYTDALSGNSIIQARFSFHEDPSLFDSSDELVVLESDYEGNSSEFSNAVAITPAGRLEAEFWYDQNSDLLKSLDEPPLKAIKVNLYQLIGAEQQPVPVTSLESDGNGIVRADGLVPGTYQLVVAEQPGLEGLVLPPLLMEQIARLTVVAGKNTAVQLGYQNKAPLFTLSPGYRQTVLPGMTVTFGHTLSASLDTSVDLALRWLDNPAATAPVIKPVSCDKGEPLATGISTPLTLKKDQPLCVQLSYFLPASRPYGTQMRLSVQATFSQGGATVVRTVTDTLTVSGQNSGQLVMSKWVANITDGEKGTDQMTRNEADPGDILEYTIRFRNAGSGAIQKLTINDRTPPFTVLDSTVACPSGGSLPRQLGVCSVKTEPLLGGASRLSWRFDGALPPGGQGEVSYRVKIE